MEDEKPPVDGEDKISLHSIEMTMTLEEERERTSDYDGSHNSNEEITSESDNITCINPVYQNTDETVLKIAQQDMSTSEQAEEHLNELTKMLNKEDDQTPKPDYEIVEIVANDTNRTDSTPQYIDMMDTASKETYPPKAEYANILGVDSNEVKYPPKADYVNISSVDNIEANNRKQDDNIVKDEYMQTKHEESAEGKDTGLLYVDTPHIDYENVGSSDIPNFIGNREFDEESGELITSSDERNKSSYASPSNHVYINGTITTDAKYEQADDLLDEEPDVDYNDKQVRFSTVVLDTEENKFEPIKLEKSKTPSDSESSPTKNENENNITDGESQSQLVDVMNEKLTLGENENVDEEITAF